MLDDLHWADRSTQLLLRHVVRNLTALPVLVLGMFRDDAPSELRQLVVDLERDDGASVIELDAFDERETGELIGSYAKATPPPDVVRRWHERTEGHPFFLHELLRQADAAPLEAAPDVDSPRSVTALIERQLSRAGGETAAVLATAAVIGHEFGLDLLAKVVGSSTDAALGAVERAVATGIVGEVPGDVDRFSFAHALVRDHLYRSQTRSRRVRVHARIAEALEHDPSASPAERARHVFEARAIVGGDRAMRACEEAARSAAAAMAYDEASAYYRLALEALEGRTPSTDEARCELLLELGTMQWRAGEPAAEETFAEAAVLARERRDARQLALAALAGRHHETGFRDEPRVALLEEALAGLEERDSVLRVRVLARLTENLHFVAAEDRALRMSDEALESARRLGDREALVAALLARHAAHLHIAQSNSGSRSWPSSTRSRSRPVTATSRPTRSNGASTAFSSWVLSTRPGKRASSWPRSPRRSASLATTTSRARGRSCSRCSITRSTMRSGSPSKPTRSRRGSRASIRTRSSRDSSSSSGGRRGGSASCSPSCTTSSRRTRFPPAVRC